jgi:hypothetical protein
MGAFFIDTASGTVATHRQLVASGLAERGDLPPRPWLRIQGTGDATTMWYAIMRRRERGIWLGALVMRHSDHHARLREQGWVDVELGDIGPVSRSIFSEDRPEVEDDPAV